LSKTVETPETAETKTLLFVVKKFQKWVVGMEAEHESSGF
jgi:hypothetical protein